MKKIVEMCTYRNNTYWAKLVNWGIPGIWFGPKMKKIILTQDVTFLQKSYGEYTKVEKHVSVIMSYERSDE